MQIQNNIHTTEHHKHSSSKNDILTDLLGKTVTNTMILEQPIQNNDQNKIIQKKKEENKTANSKPKAPTTTMPKYLGMRNSDSHKLQANYDNKFSRKTGRKSAGKQIGGLYENMKKLKSIKKNGKLIYNIDMNCDFQASVVLNNETNIKYINNNKNLNNKNNLINNNHAIKNNIK